MSKGTFACNTFRSRTFSSDTWAGVPAVVVGPGTDAPINSMGTAAWPESYEPRPEKPKPLKPRHYECEPDGGIEWGGHAETKGYHAVHVGAAMPDGGYAVQGHSAGHREKGILPEGGFVLEAEAHTVASSPWNDREAEFQQEMKTRLRRQKEEYMLLGILE